MVPRSRKTQSTLHQIVLDKTVIPFTLVQSSSRRSLSISINPKAQVKVQAPLFLSQKEILTYVHNKSDWIVQKYSNIRQRRDLIEARSFKDGNEFLFLGKKYPLKVVGSYSSRSEIIFSEESGWQVRLPVGKEFDHEKVIKAKFVEWYAHQAREFMASRVFHFGRIMGRQPDEVAVRTQKRVWGNCDYSNKRIHFNWQILQAPKEVVDYVVVHEIAHLFEPNHSPRFWRKVAEHMPNYKHHQQWLKNNAVDLTLPL